jgi:hypothetical protein
MMPKHINMLLLPASFPLAPPPRVNAMTVWASSKAMSCRGLHKKIQIIKTTRSTKRMEKKDGVLMVPSKMSVKLKLTGAAGFAGGTKVRVAKRRWTRERKVGGSWRSTMRMAMVS